MSQLFSGAVVQWHGEVMKHFTTVTDMGHPGNETFGYFFGPSKKDIGAQGLHSRTWVGKPGDKRVAHVCYPLKKE